jgi:cold-inducible RNA-binding protein
MNNSCTVYLSNLNYETDRNGIKSLMTGLGTIKNIKIIVEPTTGQSRGMAFIEMATAAQAIKVIEVLNGQKISGRTLKAKPATPLKGESRPRPQSENSKKNANKDLEFADIQLAKKARNVAKRKANPVVMKYKAVKK